METRAGPAGWTSKPIEIEWPALMTSRSMPSFWRRPMLRPVASTTRRAEISSPFDSLTVCRSGPVAMSVTLAWMNSVPAGICARTVLTSVS